MFSSFKEVKLNFNIWTIATSIIQLPYLSNFQLSDPTSLSNFQILNPDFEQPSQIQLPKADEQADDLSSC